MFRTPVSNLIIRLYCQFPPNSSRNQSQLEILIENWPFAHLGIRPVVNSEQRGGGAVVFLILGARSV